MFLSAVLNPQELLELSSTPSSRTAKGNEMYWGCFTFHSCFKHQQVLKLPRVDVCVCTCMCMCTRVKISTLPGVIVSLIHSSINTELIRFNLAAQPAVPSLNIFFIPSQPPSPPAFLFLLSSPPLSLSFCPLCFCFPSLNCFSILCDLHTSSSPPLAAHSQQVHPYRAETSIILHEAFFYCFNHTHQFTLYLWILKAF